MNTNVKARWIEALRSGEYNQTREVLANDQGFCCLGVLCEIAAAEGVVTKASSETGIVTYSATDIPGDYNDVELPWAVSQWAGFRPDESGYGYNPMTDEDYTGISTITRKATLSELNDDMDFDFDQIAEVIDRDL